VTLEKITGGIHDSFKSCEGDQKDIKPVEQAKFRISGGKRTVLQGNMSRDEEIF